VINCLQDVTGDARSRVSNYNWTASTGPRLRALLLDISRYNDTAWDTYSRLDRTLEHMAGTFWSTLSASVNALPTTDQFRLLQVLVSAGYAISSARLHAKTLITIANMVEIATTSIKRAHE